MDKIEKRKNQNSITPMIQQYLKIKSQYKDAILFFRMGDFYEMFFEDAKVASNILQIALTSRGKNSGEDVPLCGIPYHAVDSYLPKLLAKGFKVAICEQLEDPSTAKKIVKRDVVRVVTPGTITQPEYLNPKSNNYLVSICRGKYGFGLAAVDITTGEFLTSQFDSMDYGVLLNEIIRIEPQEILLPYGLEDDFKKNILKKLGYSPLISTYDDWRFEEESARRALLEGLNVASLAGFGCENMSEAVRAAGGLFQYLIETQKNILKNITSLKTLSSGDYLVLDGTTLRNLEIFKNQLDDTQSATLLDVIDNTKTAMGGRLIRKWLSKPLISVDKIRNRQLAVKEFIEKSRETSKIIAELKEFRDIDRILGKLASGNCSPRDIVALRKSLDHIPPILEVLNEFDSKLIIALKNEMSTFDEMRETLSSALVENPPLNIRDCGAIRDGFDAKLDQLRDIKNNTRKWISELEEKERQRTSISSLKVKYNKVFGYYIEVTKANLQNVPDNYIRKQTLVNAERFITPELKEYEESILNAEEKIKEIETKIFDDLVKKVEENMTAIQKTSSAVAQIDVLSNLANIAAENNYVCPEVNDSDKIYIKNGRHPVIEKLFFDEKFVPNDTYLDCSENRMMIITGPNMAGKSTYMRQVALIVILAQMGSFVPAESAEIGIVDRIFTRVGASDNLARGQSTFMLEMNETANIVNNASKRSLIILDEIGRGTSTFDGVSIAWAVAEYIHSHPSLGARTLFATHYHELTELSDVLEGVKNYNVAVREWNDEVIFLRKIVEGGTDKSYGIHVAKLAGLPSKIIERAREILKNLDSREYNEKGSLSILGKKEGEEIKNQQILPLFNKEETDVIDELRNIDINSMTPIDALNYLNNIKKKLEKGEN
ncbi:MAG: DNA mismatch repair protein MutS [Candidatus Schekmanbacteria bacterium]|nr:MAG: DNA mismatch repair protein MutS [Candidatus Schekmanbacteria bacterium]